MSKKRKIIVFLSMILALLVGASIWYVNDYYHCEEEAIAILEKEGNVIVSEMEEGYFLDGPEKENAMIFYPGAKVQVEAYLPILYNLAERGVDCFLVQMPCNLAILGMNKADSILEKYEYENWYMSGHSLGGAMAASYSAEHIEEVDGLVLFAAYTTKELESDTFTVLSIYGSEDKVLNMEKVEEGRELVQKNYTEFCIEGGNHAYFGNYGEQEGDGEATITKTEQQDITVDFIVKSIPANER